MLETHDILTGPFGRAAILSLRAPLTKHAHEHCHLILKLSGPDQRFVVQGKGLPLSENRAVLVSTWQEHSYEPINLVEPSRYLALYIDPQWLRSRHAMFESAHLPDFFRSPSVHVTAAARELAKDLCFLAQDVSATTDKASNLVYELMAEFSLQGIRHTPVQRRRDYRIRRTLKYMQTRYQEPFDYDMLANAAGLSRSRFNSLFRESVGVAPAIFGNAIRLEAAVAALQSEARAQDVAIDLGFSSAGNFNRFFQRHTGVPPGSFSRSIQRFPG